MIYQTFGIANRSCEMLQYKQKSFIPDIIANKKLNAIVDKAINAHKRRDIAADNKLTVRADKAITLTENKTM